MHNQQVLAAPCSFYHPWDAVCRVKGTALHVDCDSANNQGGLSHPLNSMWACKNAPSDESESGGVKGVRHPQMTWLRTQKLPAYTYTHKLQAGICIANQPDTHPCSVTLLQSSVLTLLLLCGLLVKQTLRVCATILHGSSLSAALHNQWLNLSTPIL